MAEKEQAEVVNEQLRIAIREIVREVNQEQIRARELDLIERVVSVEKSLENLNLRMIERFDQIQKQFLQVDRRFEDMLRLMDVRFEQVEKRFEQVDKRFEQVDKRFSQMQWTIGLGFTLMTVVMTLYRFLG